MSASAEAPSARRRARPSRVGSAHDLAPRAGGRLALLGGTGPGDRLYLALLAVAALLVPALLGVILWSVGRDAWPALREAGFTLVAGTVWDPPRGEFGAFPALAGTLVTTVLAVLLAAGPALGTAIFLSDVAPARVARPLALVVDLLAAIPSVVYGLWGMFVLVPLLRAHLLPPLVHGLGGWLPLFRGPAYGPGILAAALVLGIMILPYVSAVSREVLRAVPRAQREAALALGATRWEAIRDVVLPAARPGIVGAFVLGVGRALGEAMAVTMVVGNRHDLPSSLLAPGHTLGALLATEFSQAHEPRHVGALMSVVALLLLVTLVVNGAARWLVWRATREVRA